MKKAAIIFVIVFFINLFVPMMICFLPERSAKKDTTNSELVTLFEQKKASFDLISNGVVVNLFD